MIERILLFAIELLGQIGYFQIDLESWLRILCSTRIFVVWDFKKIHYLSSIVRTDRVIKLVANDLRRKMD
jgi:hypothetical protein